MKEKTTHIRIGEKLKRKIKVEAAKQNISMVKLAEQALESYLADTGKKSENKKLL